MPGGGGGLETRIRSLTAASAAAKAVKRAHHAAALAVQSAAPSRPRSKYFARNRSHTGSRTPLTSRRGADESEEEDEEDAGAGGRDGQVGGRSGRAGVEPAAARGPRLSEDSTSSVSRSVTSSGVSSDYTTGDETSDYEDEDEGDEEEDEEEDEDDDDDEGPRGKPAIGGAAGLVPTLSERQLAPSRVGVVAAAIEAVALARARLRQPTAAPGPGLSPTSSVATADSPRLPPVVPRTRAGSHDAADSGPIAAADGKRMEAAATGGGLSALRPQPVAAQASRRASRLLLSAAAGGGGGSGGASAAAPAPAAAALSLGAAAGGGAGVDKGDCLAEWVAQRFRSSSRAAFPGMDAEAAVGPGAAATHAKGVPTTAGGGGEANGGLRALLAARSDGAASWYARPARWHDPLSPVGALHTSVLDLRPPTHAPATQGPLAQPPQPAAAPAVSLMPLEGRAQAHP